MKKLLIGFFLLLTCQWVLAQNATTIFRNFQDKKHAEYVSAPRLVMGIIASKLKVGNLQAVLSDIHSAKVLTLNQCSRCTRKRFAKKISKLSKKGYEEFSGFKQDDNNISVMAKKGFDNMIKEAVLLISSKNNCIGILITGNINPEDAAAAMGLSQ